MTTPASERNGRQHIPCRERTSHVGTGGLVRPAGPPQQVTYVSPTYSDTRTKLVYPQPIPCPICNGSGLMVDPDTAHLPPAKRTVLRLEGMCMDPWPDHSKSGIDGTNCVHCRYRTRWDDIDGDPLHGAYVHTAETHREPYSLEKPQED